MEHQIHELKTWPEYFNDLDKGKNFELRKDDRGFKVGDFIILNEWDPKTETYTGNRLPFVIDYILRNKPEIGLMEGYCIMAVTRIMR